MTVKNYILQDILSLLRKRTSGHVWPKLFCDTYVLKRVNDYFNYINFFSNEIDSSRLEWTCTICRSRGFCGLDPVSAFASNNLKYLLICPDCTKLVIPKISPGSDAMTNGFDLRSGDAYLCTINHECQRYLIFFHK